MAERQRRDENKGKRSQEMEGRVRSKKGRRFRAPDKEIGRQQVRGFESGAGNKANIWAQKKRRALLPRMAPGVRRARWADRTIGVNAQKVQC
jgi:hypothetical protein